MVLIVSAFQCENAVADVVFCNSTGGEISYMIRTHAYPGGGIFSKADPDTYGMYSIDKGACRNVAELGASRLGVHRQWYAFLDENFEPILFPPKDHVTIKDMPKYACYPTDPEIQRRFKQDVYFFGRVMGSTYPVPQNEYCGKPGFHNFPISFGTMTSGDVEFTITLSGE